MKYVRNTNVVAYLSRGKLTLEVFEQRHQVFADPVAIELLHKFRRPRDCGIRCAVPASPATLLIQFWLTVGQPSASSFFLRRGSRRRKLAGSGADGRPAQRLFRGLLPLRQPGSGLRQDGS
jgi:hypothetical protein